jgi:hypothetical protein
MRDIIGLAIGLYLTAAMVVLGGGVYGFMSGEAPQTRTCANGETVAANWIPFVLMRAAIWPKAYYDDQNKTSDAIDWLVVRYNPFESPC